MDDEHEQLEAARLVKPKAFEAMKRFGHVVGVGITHAQGTYAVKVNLEEDVESDAHVPTEIDGVPIVVHTVGKVRKQSHAKK